MLDTSTSFVGTPLYMAPEVLTHQPHTTKLDVWSLGLVIYQLCTLKVPFPADSVDALKVPHPSANPILPMSPSSRSLWREATDALVRHTMHAWHSTVSKGAEWSCAEQADVWRAWSVAAWQAKVLQLPPPIPTDEFPAELAQLVSQMMAVDPEQRPSAAELLAVPWVAQLMANQPKLHTVLKTQATSMLLKWKQSHGVTSRIASGSEHSLDAHHSLPV
jgi:serine/threonine protein kinase